MPMRISLIVAVARNGVIGREGGLPWRLPKDMAFFKRTTMGHHVVMGRNTWSSLSRPLAGRVNVVVSRTLNANTDGAVVVRSLEHALAVAEDAQEREVFVIGGGEVYRLALPSAHRVYLTRVDADVEGDVTFPLEALGQGWTQVECVDVSADDRHAHALTLDRV